MPFAADGTVVRQGHRPAATASGSRCRRPGRWPGNIRRLRRWPRCARWSSRWDAPAASRRCWSWRRCNWTTTGWSGSAWVRCSAGASSDIRPGDQVRGASGRADHSASGVGGLACPTSVSPVAARPKAGTRRASAAGSRAPAAEQQFLARLVWLGGRQGLRLDGVGEETWQALIDAGLVRQPAGLDGSVRRRSWRRVAGIGADARKDSWLVAFADARRASVRPLAAGAGHAGQADARVMAGWPALSARTRASGRR